MVFSPASGPIKSAVLTRLRAVPVGRVTSYDVIALELKTSPRAIAAVLDGLSTDEREMVPWHRVVAKGGAIGRGPNREAQFARLVREGVIVSPAGVVQDLERVSVLTFDCEGSARSQRAAAAALPPVGSRSRGMKDRP